MKPPDDAQSSADPRLILIGAIVALIAGIAAAVVVVLLAQQVLG